MGDFVGEGSLAVNLFLGDSLFQVTSLSLDCSFETVFADFALETALEGEVFFDLPVLISSSDSGFWVSFTGLGLLSFVVIFLSAIQSENYLNSAIFDKHLLPLPFLFTSYFLSVEAVFLSSLLMKKSRTDWLPFATAAAFFLPLLADVFRALWDFC